MAVLIQHPQGWDTHVAHANVPAHALARGGWSVLDTVVEHLAAYLGVEPTLARLTAEWAGPVSENRVKVTLEVWTPRPWARP